MHGQRADEVPQAEAEDVAEGLAADEPHADVQAADAAQVLAIFSEPASSEPAKLITGRQISVVGDLRKRNINTAFSTETQMSI